MGTDSCTVALEALQRCININKWILFIIQAEPFMGLGCVCVGGRLWYRLWEDQAGSWENAGGMIRVPLGRNISARER